jgi:hypothetical protein
MNTQTGTRSQSDESKQNSSAETVLGFIIFGLLSAGAVGLVKAIIVASGVEVMCCLLGSIAAFGVLYYIYFGKH